MRERRGIRDSGAPLSGRRPRTPKDSLQGAIRDSGSGLGTIPTKRQVPPCGTCRTPSRTPNPEPRTPNDRIWSRLSTRSIVEAPQSQPPGDPDAQHPYRGRVGRGHHRRRCRSGRRAGQPAARARARRAAGERTNRTSRGSGRGQGRRGSRGRRRLRGDRQRVHAAGEGGREGCHRHRWIRKGVAEGPVGCRRRTRHGRHWRSARSCRRRRVRQLRFRPG